jgi:hypothetical protein
MDKRTKLLYGFMVFMVILLISGIYYNERVIKAQAEPLKPLTIDYEFQISIRESIGKANKAEIDSQLAKAGVQDQVEKYCNLKGYDSSKYKLDTDETGKYILKPKPDEQKK